MEVSVVKTERSQLSDKISVHLCLQRASFLGLPVTCLTEWIGMRWRHLKSCDFHRWFGLSFLTMQHRNIVDEVVFPSTTAWNTIKGRRYLREVCMAPSVHNFTSANEEREKSSSPMMRALWGKRFPDSQTWIPSAMKCLHSDSCFYLCISLQMLKSPFCFHTQRCSNQYHWKCHSAFHLDERWCWHSTFLEFPKRTFNLCDLADI